METEEEKYMARCIAMARHGAGKADPNPMVGAVIVCRGMIIGEGYHCRYGQAHAEVNAIESVKDRSLLRHATLYVNLEPCSHHGKTPPCTDMIIRESIPRVVIACQDPYPAVSGRGISSLREAGVEVVTDVMEREARELNKVFITYHTRKRPYIYLKWAQSGDGFIDRVRTDASLPPVIFSSTETLQQVHKKRSEVMAVMAGTRTALLDNPRLTVRLWSGRFPTRVVLDRNLIIPRHYHLLDGKAPTLVFSALERAATGGIEYITIDFGADVIKQVLAHLYARRLTSLLVEGGTMLLDSFLKSGLWDEMQVETSHLILGEGVKAPYTSNRVASPSLKTYRHGEDGV
jgi:diaminohydroxyphosphoribosylaminopyrimidine deaminase/5-amino-6-(5-phosphoribosylamino)uracil reductase